MIKKSLLFFLLVAGACRAFAGPIEVQSILIVPTETTAGRHPEITGSITAAQTLARDKSIEITVIASVFRPDHVMKSWTWKKVRMRAGDIRSFTIPKNYDIKTVGNYKVDFNVYSMDMKPLHSQSKKFTVVDQALPPAQTTPSEEERAHIESAAGQAAPRHEEDKHFAVGLCADTVHGTGGATVLLWPFKYAGLQASYTGGSFTIFEGRLLSRFPLSSGITPYLGAGYLDVCTERSVEIIGVKTRFHESGVSGVIGVEIPLGKRLFGSIEISGTSISLKKDVTSGSTSGTASVTYAPVTMGITIGSFLF